MPLKVTFATQSSITGRFLISSLYLIYEGPELSL